MASPISATAGLCRRSGSSGIGIDADDLDVLVDAPLLELDQHAGADAEHHVGLAPQLAAERQRDAQRIAAVEHAAAAAIAEHRRLQHGGERGHFGGGVLRAAAADDHRVLRRAEKLRGLRIAVSSSLRRAAAAAAPAASPRRSCPRRRSRIRAPPGPGRPVAIARTASATRRGACSGFRISAE